MSFSEISKLILEMFCQFYGFWMFLSLNLESNFLAHRSVRGSIFWQTLNYRKILNIRTAKNFAVITLKFEQDGFTEE